MKQVGLIGYPVAHSLSPPMQQAAFDARGIAARYVLWETRPGDLPERIGMLRAPEMLGANVTIPYKEDVVSMLDECDRLALRIGAVNTVVNRNGRLVGYNTDAPGFLRALIECEERLPGGHGFRRRVKKVVILGTGGAARGAAVALLESGVEALMMLGRTEAHVRKLVDHLRSLAAEMSVPPRVTGGLLGSSEPPLYDTILAGRDEVMRSLSSADVLINATPVGLKVDDTRLLIDVNALPASALMMDMIFNPPQTGLLRAAQARGCAALNGLTMLLYQGVRAFELWTGCDAPVEVMREALGLPM